MTKLNKKLKENLTSEINILMALQHPHIVCLVDCFETPKHINLIMEYCSLGDLSYFIKKRDRLAEHETTVDMATKYPTSPNGGFHEVVVRHFLKQLASALEFLRAKNLVHRDIKPQNLLLNPSPNFLKAHPSLVSYAINENSLVPVAGVNSLPMLKLADFGFARSLPSTSLADTLCGSPLYMAPEILRYEKYDAKADLWSVGTVLFEMMIGKPYFRAANHVELLRKIEKNEDKIRFPDDVLVSSDVKRLIRHLLRRKPVERMSFDDFFNDPVIVDDIPGLRREDLPDAAKNMEKYAVTDEKSRSTAERGLFQQDCGLGDGRNAVAQVREEPQKPPSLPPQGASSRPSAQGRRYSSNFANVAGVREARQTAQTNRRPSIVTAATAPSGQDLIQGQGQRAAVPMERNVSRNSNQVARERAAQRNEQAVRELRQRAEQDVAFERDYVVVEKQAVVMNAFADELAASPRVHGGYRKSAPQQGAMVRRATTQGHPTSTTGTQAPPSRAMQIATGHQRPDQHHSRKNSYERQYGASPTSTTSAISKALNLANLRLFGIGFSPPTLGKGPSPPQGYGAFPVYPAPRGSLILIGDSKAKGPQDEDSRVTHLVEEIASRSDVVYGFAEVKYAQLIPMVPSTDHGLGLQTANGEHVHEGVALTADAMMILSEEALVLYVKALGLLAKGMDIASAWFYRKDRGEVIGEASTPRTDMQPSQNPAMATRFNNVVQWTRDRFNITLEKAEFVRQKLKDAQSQLPVSHPNHTSNQDSLDPGRESSSDTLHLTPGVTAEKLMYERAVEMSRSAAVNELIGEDLKGCEMAYLTALRMLEAILENEDSSAQKKGSTVGQDVKTDLGPINGVEAEDRKDVEKRENHSAPYVEQN